MLAGRHEPVLGTTLELLIDATSEACAREAERAVLAEFDRLERVFSVYATDSELCRWQRAEITDPGEELRALLRLSLEWFERGRGAYNPAVGRLTARWKEVSESGTRPSAVELSQLAASIATAPYAFDDDGVLTVTGDIGGLSFNAIAKGFIVDRAAAVALACDGVTAVMLSAGGDLVHSGGEPIAVGVEDPFNPYDNAPPLSVVNVHDAGLATSGSARRGFVVDGVRYGHVIDPRTGWPVEHVASVSVMADDAVTADVVATITGVLPIDEAMAFADSVGVACLIVPIEGPVVRNERWLSAER
ncbi:MAG: FAD:protein FMN transferase [Acidimicrobiia bacterium]